MKITTYHSYILPFKYKGWDISVEEQTAFWSDAKVKVTLNADPHAYLSIIQNAFASSLHIKSNDYIQLLTNKDFSKAIELTMKLVSSKPSITFSVSANGGLLDRFMGQNCSAVKKIREKIIEYIDRNIGMPITTRELVDYIKAKI